MRALRRFIVRPVLPPPLQPLARLATNLRWAWHTPSQELFRAIDPAGWEASGHDPIRLLATVEPERFDTLAADDTFVSTLAALDRDLEDYLTGPRWFSRHAPAGAPAAIGYFSAEFGVSEVLPQYSGGLGILAGDHLKAASDLGVPIVGVGLLYHHGYFRQSLNAEGWQQERYPLLDPNAMPLTLLTDAAGDPVLISVPLEGRTLQAQIWVAQVGRIPLLMMDSDIPANDEYGRLVTDRLYGGGAEHRLAQEVLLGVGGVRALRAWCGLTGHPTPEVYHCNEGHAGFLGLERIREAMVDGADFDTAVELTRGGTVFTTHTPVPAGIDRFERSAVQRQFSDFAPLPIDQVLALGAEDYPGGDPGRFNMAVMGLRLAGHSNGVSALHGEVSREMFNGLWPGFDATEVPIRSVTNGVHHLTWMHPEFLELLTASTGGASTVDGYDWSALERVDDQTIWLLKRKMRADLVAMARERLAASHAARGLGGGTGWIEQALDPNVLTLGFARRGASYKRLTLMLRDPERLKALLTDPERGIQIVIAGKSHPADDTGKALIQQMVRFADAEDVRRRIVFLPDYDISLARPLYPGCDVWMNNPLRPFEACGTSGMKAALNGAANLSIRDGWWDEWSDPRCGWDIPSAEGIADPDQRDATEAETLYSIIENQIVPRFYDRDSAGVPTRWVQQIRDTVSILGPKVLASRMVRDYVEQLYTPAAEMSRRTGADGVAAALADWKRRVRQLWPQVRILHVETLTSEVVQLGDPIAFGAVVDLGGLTPDDVEVQAVAGRLSGSDELLDLHSYPFTEVQPDGSYWRYSVQRAATRTGSRGFTARVVPKHPALRAASDLGLAVLPEG